MKLGLLAIALGLSATLLLATAPRSSSAVRAFQTQTGHPGGWAGRVVDHIIPLCAGGADAPSNMQWQLAAASYRKDAFERALCRALVVQGYHLVKS